MTSREQALSDFMDAWSAGRRPRVSEYLDRVAPAERAGLAEEIEEWLVVAPVPDYAPEARAAIRAEPVVQRVLQATTGSGGLLAVELPRLREQRRLSLRDLAARVVELTGLRSDDVGRAEDYLRRTEAGELDTTRLSRRLLEALAGALDVSAERLVQAAALGAASVAPAPPRALYRRNEIAADAAYEDLEVLAAAASAPAPSRLDELDRLFVGGPDA